MQENVQLEDQCSILLHKDKRPRLNELRKYEQPFTPASWKSFAHVGQLKSKALHLSQIAGARWFSYVEASDARGNSMVNNS